MAAETQTRRCATSALTRKTHPPNLHCTGSITSSRATELHCAHSLAVQHPACFAAFPLLSAAALGRASKHSAMSTCPVDYKMYTDTLQVGNGTGCTSDSRN